MSKHTTTSAASEVERWRHALLEHRDWPSPEAGFVAYVAHTDSAPLSFGTLALSHAEHRRLHEAPMLAAIGFALASASVDEATQSEWAQGFARLARRDPFPADRISFVYEPVTLLGVCLGAMLCRGPSPEAIEWLRGVVARLEALIDPTQIWQRLLGALAAHTVSRPWGPHALPDSNSLTVDDLSLLRWLCMKFPAFAASQALDASSVDEALRARFESGVPLARGAERLVLGWIAFRSLASDESSFHSGSAGLGSVSVGATKSFAVARSRAALFSVERELADPRSRAKAAPKVYALAEDISDKAVAGVLRALANRLHALEQGSESAQQSAAWSIAQQCRDAHRYGSFEPSAAVDDPTFRKFLEAAVHEDSKLGMGELLSLLSVERRARLTSEIATAAAARAIEEDLAYIQDLDGKPYGFLLEHEDVAFAIQQLPKHSEQATPATPTQKGTEPRMVDIGILTIKDEEFEAILEAFPRDRELFVGPKTKRHYNLRTADAGGGASYRVAILRQVEQGTGEAQHAARDMIEELSPKLILVVGIAGGLPGTGCTLGDVVLSQRINDYTVEARKEGAEPMYAMSGGAVEREIEYVLANLRARVADLGDWAGALPERPRVEMDEANFYGSEDWKRDVRGALALLTGSSARPLSFRSGVIASSDRLIKDTTVLLPWLETARHLLAVEMESCGVYRAARGRCAMLAIRGLSDLVGFKRDEAWTRFACTSAAAFTRAFLCTTPISPASNTSAPVASAPRPEVLSASERSRKTSAQPLTTSTTSAPVASAPPPVQVNSQTPFFPTRASVERRRGNGATPHVVWQLEAVLPAGIDATRAEFHEALQSASVTYDMQNYGRTARWPRVLHLPSVTAESRSDGSQHWRHLYQNVANDAGEEQLALRRDGTLLFQRDTLWDVDNMAVEFGSLTSDTFMFICLVARFVRQLGSVDEAALTLRLQTSQTKPGTLALFSGTSVEPEQPDRTARLEHPFVTGTIRVAPNGIGEWLPTVTKRLLDRIANEFVLEPSMHRSPGPSFLAIRLESLAALSRSIVG